MGEWKTIDELPQDNQEVLMAWPNGVIMQGKFFYGDSMLTGFAVNKGKHYVGKIGVSHWTPLPDAPTNSKEGI